MPTYCCIWLAAMLFPCLAFSQFPQPGIQQPASPTFSSPQPASLAEPIGMPHSASQNPHQSSLANDPHRQAQQDIAAHQQREAHLQQILKEANQDFARYQPVGYTLPNNAPLTGQKMFDSALQGITAMLKGKTPLSLKQAIFLTENAYFDNSMNYEAYSQTINNMVAHCTLALQQSGLDASDPLAKLMILHKFMADTLTVQVPGEERPLTTYPMKYDFEDFWGEEDITKQMVSKLMTTTTGQCHSMPLLFLILAEQMDVEAHLALAPEHSYVKFQDEQGNWYNLELTNGRVTTDEFIMQSGYIKAEALRQGLYMRPLSKQETVAQTLNDLGFYYTHRYGIDSFVGEIVETMETHAPEALLTAFWQANYRTVSFQHVVEQYQARGAAKSVVDADTTAMRMLQQMYEAYDRVDQMGYEPMPKETYQRWLNSLDEAAQQDSHRKGLLKINEMLAP